MIEILFAITLISAILFSNEEENNEITNEIKENKKEINNININGSKITTITRKNENENNE